MHAIQSFKSFTGSTVQVLDDGRAIETGILGRMLITKVGGQFVRFLTDDEVVTK